jgi:hypothetical protein
LAYVSIPTLVSYLASYLHIKPNGLWNLRVIKLTHMFEISNVSIFIS